MLAVSLPRPHCGGPHDTPILEALGLAGGVALVVVGARKS